MRYFEIRPCNRPTHAGKAVLEFSGEVVEPHRDGDVIVLPVNPDVELFRLQPNWNQFLISTQHGTWFGGTDENPFLVQMETDFMGAFMNAPTKFYEMLIPGTMRRLQELFPHITCRRQGDIFAFLLPYTWEDIRKSFEVCHAKGLKMVEDNGMSVFGTRHLFTGNRITLNSERNLLGGLVHTLAEGKVVAPDHEDITLGEVNALAQTAHLFDPKTAD